MALESKPGFCPFTVIDFSQNIYVEFQIVGKELMRLPCFSTRSIVLQRLRNHTQALQ